MRTQDVMRLTRLHRHHMRGGLPDLGSPHSKAGYRWCIGRARFEDGVIRPWRENLGRTKLLAQYRARAMVDVWLEHYGNTGGVASEDWAVPIDRAMARAAAFKLADEQMRYPRQIAAAHNAELSGHAYSPGFKLVVVPVETPDHLALVAADPSEDVTPTEAKKEGCGLHALFDRWIAKLGQSLGDEEISPSYVERAERVVRVVKREFADREITSCGADEIDELRRLVQHRRKKDGKRRDISTVRTELGILLLFFEHLIERGRWTPPVNWRRRLRADARVDHGQNDDDDEGHGKKHDTYALEELTKIYQVASKSLRTWMLNALNHGWGQNEIATAKKMHWKTASGRKRVARRRHKRQPNADAVPGRWLDWDETWDLSLARMARTPDDPKLNPKGLAFLTVQHQPLVRYIERTGKPRRRYDVIAAAFEEACEKARVRHRGFYLLRHTGINMIKKIANEEVANLYCQHAPEGMTAKRYLNADWPALYRALRKMRKQLQPMFEGAAVVRLDEIAT